MVWASAQLGATTPFQAVRPDERLFFHSQDDCCTARSTSSQAHAPSSRRPHICSCSYAVSPTCTQHGPQTHKLAYHRFIDQVAEYALSPSRPHGCSGFTSSRAHALSTQQPSLRDHAAHVGIRWAHPVAFMELGRPNRGGAAIAGGPRARSLHQLCPARARRVGRDSARVACK